MIFVFLKLKKILGKNKRSFSKDNTQVGIYSLEP